MRLHRLLGIIMLLDSRGVMKAGSLAKILETSERTIYRDIDILCEAGIPICAVSGPNGGYSFMEGYSVNTNSLGYTDVFNLLLSGMGIRPEKDTEAEQQLKNAFIKLENNIAEEHRSEIIEAKKKFFMDSDPWWGQKPSEQYLEVIKDAVLHLKKLLICYKKYTGESSERTLRPYGAVVKNSEWYLTAFCESQNEVRVFKCSRIESVEVLDESFTIPAAFHLQHFWEENKTAFVNRPFQKKTAQAYTVKIKCSEANKLLLSGFESSPPSWLTDGCLYAVDMLSFETACSILFPLSDRIEVLEPKELREHILDKANKILNLYKR